MDHLMKSVESTYSGIYLTYSWNCTLQIKISRETSLLLSSFKNIRLALTESLKMQLLKAEWWISAGAPNLRATAHYRAVATSHWATEQAGQYAHVHSPLCKRDATGQKRGVLASVTWALALPHLQHACSWPRLCVRTYARVKCFPLPLPAVHQRRKVGDLWTRRLLKTLPNLWSHVLCQ